jgi:phage shock protein A
MNYEAILGRPMPENEAKKRELVVAALVQKNNLTAEVSKLEHYIMDLATKASTALKSGDEQRARMFFDEKYHYEPALEQTRKNLLTATELTERMKAVIREEEEKSRKKGGVNVNYSPQKKEDIQRKINEALAQFALGTKEDTKRVASAQLGSAQDLLAEMQDLRVHLEKLEGEWLEYEIRQHTRKGFFQPSGDLARFPALIARLLGRR